MSSVEDYAIYTATNARLHNRCVITQAMDALHLHKKIARTRVKCDRYESSAAISLIIAIILP